MSDPRLVAEEFPPESKAPPVAAPGAGASIGRAFAIAPEPGIPAKTGAAPATAEPTDDLSDFVEATDLPPLCPDCLGWGQRRIGFGSRTEDCPRCDGEGRLRFVEPGEDQ